jgi:uncharacterized protein
MPEPDFDAAIQYALSRLREELSPALTYHSLWHTENDVMPAAQRLAQASRLGWRQQRLLAVAAAYHDIGFIVQYVGHEQAGAEMAALLLPGFGFSSEDVASICGLIGATCMPARPNGLLQAIMNDADLDVLGRDDFFERSELLWQEVCTFQQAGSRDAWLQEQVDFLHQHRYFTDAARALRDERKRRNLLRLEEIARLKSMSASEGVEDL